MKTVISNNVLYGLIFSLAIVFAGCSASQPNIITGNGIEDVNPPELYFQYPTNNSLLSSTFSVYGYAYDFESLDGVFLSVNSNDFQKVASNSVWSFNLTLSNGEHILQAFSRDMAGNTSQTDQVCVTVDAYLPSVFITNPVSNAIVPTNVMVSGYANDNDGVSAVYLSANTFNYQRVNGTSVWSSNLVLAPGNRTITVYAIDMAGNAGGFVQVLLKVDDSAPSLTLYYPTNNTLVFDDLSVSGFSSDNYSLEGIYLSDNGGEFVKIVDILSNLSSTNFNASVSLSDGYHQIRVFAKDRVSKTSSTNQIELNKYTFSGPIVYVGTNGNDSYPGMKEYPVLTIQKALSLANSRGLKDVYVQGGRYVPGFGLNVSGPKVYISNSQMHLSGGWNSNYTMQDQVTVLDGNNHYVYERIIFVENVSNVTIDHLTIIRGRFGNATHGGGIELSGARNCLLRNLEFISNSSWGAVALLNSHSNQIIDCLVTNNLNGGIILYESSSNIVESRVVSSGNYGVFLDYAHDNYINCETAYNKQAGCDLMFATNNIILNTLCFNSNAGINMSWSASNWITNIRVISNYQMWTGGGIRLYDSSYNFIHGYIDYNVTTNEGGGLYLRGNNNYVNAVIDNNKMLYYTGKGGGVYILGNSNNICGSVFFNEASIGGGIYNAGSDNTISASVYNNIPDDVYP